MLNQLNIVEISKLTNVDKIPKSFVNMITHEECAELIQATSKFYRNKGSYENLCEEIVDVSICLGWLIQKYNITSEDLSTMIKKKTDRINFKMNNNTFVTQEGD